MNVCMVSGCRYIAESAIEDFRVCVLHDSPKVRTILEAGNLPGAYWWPDGRPIVVPCGELTFDSFVPREAGEANIYAADDPQMLEVPEGQTKMLRPEFDLSEG